ncbi:general stress protein [Sporosarcina sp. JAI121]|uniref:general stress protein n=1 Tax=Sporosarcina sp. JAI121 TaxID=2723064 RepID=UPI0015CCBE84|nr:general stress protein [Sporosarcina sp. JAI121]NYF23210.1 Holliday junction resolvasome RuvABC DNA-binding subunit [Sporosarcina sp. JAI121]
MKNKTHSGSYQSIDEALHKITEMIALGYNESDIYVVSNTAENISMFKGKSDVEHLETADEDWLNRFTLFLNGEESILNALAQMGFSEQQSRSCYNEVEKGGVALFIEGGTTKLQPDEMDSSAELGLSEEVLDGQDENQHMTDNEATVPRLNTRNL